MPPWMMSIQPCIQTCSFWIWALAGLNAQNCGTVGFSRPWVVYAARCGSSNHQRSVFTIEGMHGIFRPSPVFSRSLLTLGWIIYLKKSLATVTFLAPFGTNRVLLVAWLGTGLPSLLSARPIVTMLS